MAMIEYFLIEKPSHTHIRKYARRFAEQTLGPAHPSSKEDMLSAHEKMAASNMLRDGNLLLVGRRSDADSGFTPFGFLSYHVHHPQEFNDVGRVSGVFDCGELKFTRSAEERIRHVKEISDPMSQGMDFKYGSNDHDSVLKRSELRFVHPYSTYSHCGALVSVDHMEIGRFHRNQGIGSELLRKMVEIEGAEIVDGLAHPRGLGFFAKLGAVLPLYAGESTVFAVRNVGFEEQFQGRNAEPKYRPRPKLSIVK